MESNSDVDNHSNFPARKRMKYDVMNTTPLVEQPQPALTSSEAAARRPPDGIICN